MTLILSEPATAVVAEQRLVLWGIPWRQYEAVLAAFPEQGGLRITYIDGRLTLLSPTRRHNWHEHFLGNFVKAVAWGLGIPWEPAVHTTYRREDVGAGVEGDQTFYLGANARLMRGPVNVDLSIQPPPDLAIEVEVTHSAADSIAVWGRLGVPEVWRLDVPRGVLVFGARQADGTYAPIPRSAAFPELEPNDVLDQLKRAEQLGSSEWVAELPDWISNTLLPRRGR